MAFSFRRTLTVDHLQVPASQTAFPVLVKVTNSTLRTVANGGHVRNSSGFDINFFSDSALTTKLFWEMDFYDPVAGTVIAWVRTDISSVSDTTFFMGYGDASIVTFQSTVTTVWSNSFTGVWHLPNGSVLTALDSTVSGNNGTVGANAAVAGQINGGSNQSASLTLPETTNSVWVLGDTTVSGWFKDTTDTHILFATANVSPLWDVCIGDALGQGATTTRLNIESRNGGAVNILNGTTSVIDGIPHLFHVTRLASNGQNKIYVDGALQSTGTLDTGTINTGTGGSHSFGTLTGGFADEMRLAATVRDANWIAIEFSNQKTASTFVALGSETPVGAAVTQFTAPGYINTCSLGSCSIAPGGLGFGGS